MVIRAAAAVLLCSCASGGDSPAPERPQGESLPVSIRARVADALYTRAYQPYGQVIDGTYYLTYETKNSTPADRKYALASVTFGDEAEPSTGIATKIEEGEAINNLTWEKDVVNATSIFRLDNVPPSLDTAADTEKSDTLVVFGTGADAINPFVAGVFDDKNGTNDLLWGSEEVGYNTTRIHFDLHHYMSRVKVVVTANKEYSVDDALNLDGAEVKITSLVLTPKSYNRIDGSLDLGENPEYKDLVLTGEGIDWGTTPDDEKPEEGYMDVRTTRDFVLPPQGLRDKELRPRLVITLKDGNVYSGILPHAMEVVMETKDQNDNTVTGVYPVALAFLREHILTLRTVITEDPPELLFMPVTVIEWVDKGDFLLEGHQAGVYNLTDFMNLVDNYENYNEEQLERFGLDAGSKWEFNFWGPVEIANADEVKGKMVPDDTRKPYIFKFHGYKCTVAGKEYSQDEHDEFVELLGGTVGLLAN